MSEVNLKVCNTLIEKGTIKTSTNQYGPQSLACWNCKQESID